MDTLTRENLREPAEAPMAPAIEARNLTVAYGAAVRLSGVTLPCSAGA
jgi:hypothetical protein